MNDQGNGGSWLPDDLMASVQDSGGGKDFPGGMATGRTAHLFRVVASEHRTFSAIRLEGVRGDLLRRIRGQAQIGETKAHLAAAHACAELGIDYDLDTRADDLMGLEPLTDTQIAEITGFTPPDPTNDSSSSARRARSSAGASS